MFHVKKRTLLLIAGIVWLIAGFNVARLGVLSYRVIESNGIISILISSFNLYSSFVQRNYKMNVLQEVHICFLL